MTKIMKQFDNIEDGIQNMIAAATHDYQGWMKPETEIRAKMNKAVSYTHLTLPTNVAV